jgi:uncharacterized membrane protein (UPF0127 family)
MSNIFNIILGSIDPKISQFMTTVDNGQPQSQSEVGIITSEEQERTEQEQIEKEKKRLLQQQRTLLDKQIQSMAAIEPQPLTESNFEDLERQEETDKEEREKQNTTDMLNKMTQQQQNQNQQMMTMQMISSRWVRAERANAKIIFNKNAVIHCDVAATPQQQVSGLQAYDCLDVDRGLWFPQNNKRIASFHMGNVKFPIDIIFIDGNKVAKVIDNIMPGQFGSWSSSCTDVIEVNGNWAVVNNVNPGDTVETPLSKIAVSEIERLINTSWSAPQDARITSTRSYDLLRTLTEASGEENWEEGLFETFPFLRQAQENKDVKPDMHQKQPGEIDLRNPTDRFEHNTLPDEFSPFGDGGSIGVDPFTDAGNDGNPGGVSGRHFQYTRGWDPTLTDPERLSLTPIEPTSDGLKAPVRRGYIEDFSELEQANLERLMQGSITLLHRFPLEWGPSSDSEYNKEAIITDLDIDDWITSLEWEEDDKNKLRSISSTDNYKKLLGRVLQDSVNGISGFEIKESDLYLYR